ncbi:MAG: nitrogen regulation protein NR(II) [Geobacteraceae bacterium]
METIRKTFVLRIIFLVIFVAGISVLHYFTPLSLPMLHDIFQRLYYIPIIMAAFWFGLRGGVGCALIVSIAYAPHVLFQWGEHVQMELEKYLEILLYNVVGGITGLLSQREQTQTQQLQQTALGLEQSYEQLRRQSERITEMEGQLRKAERLSTIGELAAVLAHEIRNPLGSIQGTAEILKDDFQPGDRKYEFLEIMVKESKRLNNVVEDFLRLARPQPVLMGECDLLVELNNVISLVSSEARQRSITLECRVDSLPAIEGDPEKLRQAFLNIILNGLQAATSGGSVIISTQRDQPGAKGSAWVELLFADSGPGILSEETEKIFEPFFTTKEGGTGLGLAITRKIIEGHGGSITVESKPGSGAVFYIRLPVKSVAARESNET